MIGCWCRSRGWIPKSANGGFANMDLDLDVDTGL